MQVWFCILGFAHFKVQLNVQSMDWERHIKNCLLQCSLCCESCWGCQKQNKNFNFSLEAASLFLFYLSARYISHHFTVRFLTFNLKQKKLWSRLLDALHFRSLVSLHVIISQEPQSELKLLLQCLLYKWYILFSLRLCSVFCSGKALFCLAVPAHLSLKTW